jgi:hypothetical protein
VLYYDVISDSDRLEEMLEHSNGAREVPVILDGNQVSIGYGGS